MKTHRLANPDRVYFDLHDTQLASSLAWKSIEVDDALLKSIRVAQHVTGVTRIVLETKAHTDFSVSLEPNPYRLVVEVRKAGVGPKSELDRFPNYNRSGERQTSNPGSSDACRRLALRMGSRRPPGEHVVRQTSVSSLTPDVQCWLIVPGVAHPQLACVPRLNKYNVGLFGPRSKWNNSRLIDIACPSSQAGEMPLCTYPRAAVVIRLCYRPLVGQGPVDSSPQEFTIRSAKRGLPQEWLIKAFHPTGLSGSWAISRDPGIFALKYSWQVQHVRYSNLLVYAQRSAPMADVLVCNDKWKAVKNGTFTWHNPDKNNDVTFTQNGPWPFTLPPGFTVLAGSKKDCGLIGTAGTYHYTSSPCSTKVNPKTVIIT